MSYTTGTQYWKRPRALVGFPSFQNHHKRLTERCTMVLRLIARDSNVYCIQWWMSEASSVGKPSSGAPFETFYRFGRDGRSNGVAECAIEFPPAFVPHPFMHRLEVSPSSMQKTFNLFYFRLVSRRAKKTFDWWQRAIECKICHHAPRVNIDWSWTFAADEDFPSGEGGVSFFFLNQTRPMQIVQDVSSSQEPARPHPIKWRTPARVADMG